MLRVRLVVAFCGINLVVAQARGQFPAKISAPRALNTNAATDTGGDFTPQVATDGQGHWVAVWTSTDDLGGTIGTDSDILVTRSRDNGVTWTAPEPLNGNAGSDTGSDGAPAISTDGRGTWLVVWSSNENLGGVNGMESDILFARSTNNGETWTPPASLNTDAAADSRLDQSPRIATDGQGNWVTVWSGTVVMLPMTLGKFIVVSHSTDNGMTWSDIRGLDPAQPDTRRDSSPDVATDGHGNWVAVWTSIDLSGGSSLGTDTDILVSRSNNNGATWTASVPLNSNAGSDTGADADARIAMDAQGNAVVVWNSQPGGVFGMEGDISVARSSNAGATWSESALLNTNAAGDVGADEAPSITTDGHGNWVATWDGNTTATGTVGVFDVFVAYSGDNGATWTAPAPVNTGATAEMVDDYVGQVAADGRGNWVVVWYVEPFPGDPDAMVARFALPDCNNNGIGDDQDIADGTSRDCNSNGIPDDCETDSDGDGVIDACDNCPNIANADQADANGNGIGDACDTPIPGNSACGTCGGGTAAMMPLTLTALIGLRRKRK